MHYFLVDSDQLNSAVATTSGHIEQVRSSAHALTSTLTSLESHWKGQGSASFLAAVQKWRTAQISVENAIQELNRALSSAAAHYSNTEQNISSLFAG